MNGRSQLLAIGSLAVLGVSATIGVVVLISAGHSAPASLVAIASSVAGALAAFLVPRSAMGGKNNGS